MTLNAQGVRIRQLFQKNISILGFYAASKHDAANSIFLTTLIAIYTISLIILVTIAKNRVSASTKILQQWKTGTKADGTDICPQQCHRKSLKRQFLHV